MGLLSGEAELGGLVEHVGVGGLVLIGDGALEDGLLDGVLDEPHLAAPASRERPR